MQQSVTGLGVRLDDDKGENLEVSFPSSCSMSALGNQMTATIYAFKKGRTDTYRKNEGIIFTINGQTHGHLTPEFFRRKQVGLSYLSDSILVAIDCSQFGGRAREDLFMNSRDRLSSNELRTEIEKVLEDLLKHHEGLRALKERRRREEIESKLTDSKPLENILKSLIERHPSLSTLFLSGQRASNPFKTIKVKEEEKPFEGKRYPTYFRFKGKNDGVELHRDCHINMRCRIAFETDAVNDYLNRGVDPGIFSLYMVANGSSSIVETRTLNLQNGIATLSLQLPPNCREGDTLHFRATVTDHSRVEPFVNTFAVHVKKAAESASGNGKRHKPPAKEEGKDRELPSGIQLPPLKKIYESDWQNHRPPFDHYTALRIKHAGNSEETDDDNEQNIYDFFINMDNQYLKRYLKYELTSGQDERVVQTRFEIGMVLIGLALLQNHNSVQKEKETADTGQEETRETHIEDQVSDITKALAPFLLPMIDSLGDLDLEDSPGMGSSGEVV